MVSGSWSVQNRINQVLETIMHLDRQEQLISYQGGKTGRLPTWEGVTEPSVICSPNGKPLTRDALVVGALETTFVEMVSGSWSVQNRINQVLETIMHLDRQEQLIGYQGGKTGRLPTWEGVTEPSVICSPNGKPLTRDALVVGALETTFVEMVSGSWSVQNRINQVLETIMHLDRQEQLIGYQGGKTGRLPTWEGVTEPSVVCSPNGKPLTRDALVVGALETAFVEMVSGSWSVQNRINQVLETIMHLDRQEQLIGYQGGKTGRLPTWEGVTEPSVVCSPNGKPLTRDALVVGELETTFVEMDEQVAEEKRLWRIPGGCAALCVVFFLGKAYVANAGDCRAIVSSPPPPPRSDTTHQPATSSVIALSRDFTPDNERKRLQLLAYRAQDLIGTAFTRLEYSRFLTRRDLKKKVLYRDWYMDGWAAKTVRDADIRPPLISDGRKKRRLLNTIGVTRGFGDHHLMTVDDNIPLKPFLSPVPEVQVFNLTTMDTLTDRDVLIMASDGLWDVLTNQQAHSIVQAALAQTDTDERSRYTMAAQDLVIAARGNPSGANGRWQLSPVTATGPTGASQPASTYNHQHLSPASTDDISCFVVPLKYALAPPVLEDDDDIELLT